jgi:hypothetical protein
MTIINAIPTTYIAFITVRLPTDGGDDEEDKLDDNDERIEEIIFVLFSTI